MPLVLGVDEAGYGPNLGPLVIALTLWEIPDELVRFDFWKAFEGVVSQSPDASLQTVHVADSKVVHSSAAGIAAIERSATVLLRLNGLESGSLFGLWDGLTDRSDRINCREPWYCGDDLALPIAPHAAESFRVVDGWSETCERVGCRLVAVGCEILPSRLFNSLVRKHGSKGRVLTWSTLNLVRRFWNPERQEAVVICDKHGGRDRYSEFLIETYPEQMPLCVEESRNRSRYRIGRGEIRFGVRSEENLPVAAASIVAKYIREAAMEAFNRYWTSRIPGLRPTRGYPVDAARFFDQISKDAEKIGLSKDDFWRSK